MPTERNSLAVTRTLRFRLMIWNAAVVLFTAIVTMVGLREAVRFTLIRELDQLLSEDVREIELSLANFDGAQSKELHEQLDRKDAGHAQHKWFVQLINRQGEVVYQSQHAPAAIELSTPVDLIPKSYLEWRFFDRIVGDTQIRIGSSLELIRADIRRIDRLVGISIGMVLLIAPLGGYWLAGQATRPLNQMITTMAGLRPSQLNERLKIRGTGDELDRLSETFNHLLDRIGSYLQDRRDFLANAAHELRTPLAAIRSGIDVTLVKPRSSEEYQNLLTDIGSEATALSQLVNQLLLLSETESERLREHTERVRLDELIDKARDMFEGVAESKHIALDVSQSLPTEVLGNPHHLRQVIYNLLDNALKFTPPGGRIAIELEHDHKEAVVTFQDSGIGIPEGDLQRVFERFYQIDRRRQLQLDETSATATTEATATANTPATTDADATTAGDPTIDEAPRGTGLGLSICRAIVLAHKGTIRAMSQPNQGTRFVVRLPLATAAGEASLTR